MRSDYIIPSSLTRTQQIRRADIITAAITVINRDGYAAMSIDKIAKQVGTAKSTVLYYFKTKQAINDAIIGTVYEDGAAYMTPPIRAATTHRERLRAYITANLQYIADHTDQIAAIHRIMQNAPFEDRGQSAIDILQRMLEKGIEAGEFGGFDARTLAITLRLTIDGSSFYMIDEPELDVQNYIQEIATIFDKTLKA